MNFLLSDDLVQFQEALGRFLGENFPLSGVRSSLLEPGVSWRGVEERGWKALADLGVFAAAAPERVGGLGLGMQAAFVTIVQSAKVLLPLPIFETIAYGVTLLSALPQTEASDQLLSEICTGEQRVAGCIDGAKEVVSSLERDLILLSPQGVVSHRVVESGEFERVQTIDLVRPYFRLALKSDGEAGGEKRQNTPSERVLGECDREGVLLRLALLSVAELIGISERAIEMTKEYVQTRKQFDRAVGSFQAVQHKLVDAFLKGEQIKALALFAAWAAENDPSQFPSAVAAAKGLASSEVPKVIETAVQLHGGIGFTYEYDLHLLLRRARALSSLFGGEEQWFAQLGAVELGGGCSSPGQV